MRDLAAEYPYYHDLPEEFQDEFFEQFECNDDFESNYAAERMHNDNE